MASNVEIKARVTDPRAMRARMESFGTTAPDELVQIDTFYNVPTGRLKLRESADGTGELIYYQRADDPGPRVSNYFRASSSDPASLRDVLARSLGVRATVRKRRSVFLFGQTRIHLDQVEGLGSFIEFEVVLRDGQPVSDGERIATSLINAFSVRAAVLIPHAYVDLLESRERM